MIVMGIDPGQTGAIAVLGEGRLDVIDMPVGNLTVGLTTRKRVLPELLAYKLKELLPVDVCYIEEVAAMPKQGLSSTFTFGQSHGLVLGAVAAIGVRIVRVRPNAWQTAIRAKGDPRPHAMQRYPELVGQLQRVKDEGRADAILIAHYGRKMEDD